MHKINEINGVINDLILSELVSTTGEELKTDTVEIIKLLDEYKQLCLGGTNNDNLTGSWVIRLKVDRLIEGTTPIIYKDFIKFNSKTHELVYPVYVCAVCGHSLGPIHKCNLNRMPIYCSECGVRNSEVETFNKDAEYLFV